MTTGDETLGAESLRGVNAPMTVFRPTQTEHVVPAAETPARRSGRDFSDAEAVVLLYRDSPDDGAGNRI